MRPHSVMLPTLEWAQRAQLQSSHQPPDPAKNLPKWGELNS